MFVCCWIIESVCRMQWQVIRKRALLIQTWFPPANWCDHPLNPLLSIFPILSRMWPHLYNLFFQLTQLLWPHCYQFSSNFVHFYPFNPTLSNCKCTFLFPQSHCCGPSWWACQMWAPCVPGSDKWRESAHALSDKHRLCWSLKHAKHFSPALFMAWLVSGPAGQTVVAGVNHWGSL